MPRRCSISVLSRFCTSPPRAQERRERRVIKSASNMKQMARIFLTVAAVAVLPVYGQYEATQGEAPSAEAALTPPMLKTLQDSTPLTPQLRAVRDALANNSVHSLAIN